MGTYTVDVAGKAFDITSDASQEDLDAYFQTEEGQAELQARLSEVESAPAAPAGPPGPDIQAAGDAAVQQYAESLSGPERFAIGAGKAVSDLTSGVQQLFGGDDVTERIRRENKLYGVLDEGIGAEDFGEFAGTVGTYMAGGTAGATIKGSAVLGSIIEGLKATDSGELSERGINAAIGGTLGAAGAAVGKQLAGVFTEQALKKADPKLGPVASEILRDAPDPLTAKATIEAAAPGTKRLLGALGLRRLGFFSVRGTSEVLQRANKASSAAIQAQERAGAREIKATGNKLYARQAEELAGIKEEYFKKTRTLFNKLNPDAQRAVVFQSSESTLAEIVKTLEKTTARSVDEVGTKLVRQPKAEGVPRNAPATYATQQVKGTKLSSTDETLESAVSSTKNKSSVTMGFDEVLQKSVVDLGGGRAGIDPATFLKLTGFMNKDLKEALPLPAQKQIESVIRLMQRNPTKKVISTQEIESQLLELSKIKSAELQKLIANPMNKSQQKIANDILDSIIMKSKLSARAVAGGLAGTQEGVSDATGYSPEALMQIVIDRGKNELQ